MTSIFQLLWFLFASVCFAANQPFTEITATDGQSGDQLSYSLDVSSGLVIAGAPFKNNYRGVVYLFNCAADSSCPVVTEFHASDAANGDAFGSAAAIDGNLVVVGAPYKAAYKGAAYVFSCTSTSCAQTAAIVPAAVVANDFFGTSVAISGTTVIVGAPGTTARSGIAYAFSCGASSCTLITQLPASPTSLAGDKFGSSVAISGNLVAVGAAGEKSNEGAVYTYTCTSSSCAFLTRLAASDGKGSDFFGWSVTVSDSLVAVGATGKNFGQGAAYLFDCDTTSNKCTELATMQADDGASDDSFGSSVSLSGSLVMVGALNKGNGRGGAYIFSCDLTSCSQTVELSASNTLPGDYFGRTLSLYGSLVMVGVDGKNQGNGEMMMWRPTCEDIPCLNGGTCDTFGPSHVCSCPSGFHGAFCEQDYNECLGQNGGDSCSANGYCSNTFGAYTCLCNSGFYGDGFTCTDYNECAGENGGNTCHSNASCVNTAGGYTCSCNGGLTGDGRTCADNYSSNVVIQITVPIGIGIGIGVALFIILVVCIVFTVLHFKKRKQQKEAGKDLETQGTRK